MSKTIECIPHCDAGCCTYARYFRFSGIEARLLISAGTNLVMVGEEDKTGRADYEKEGPCGLKKKGKCDDYDNRPIDCRNFRVGSRQCLVFRAEHSDIVKVMTDADRTFQNEYFGLD